MSKVVLNRNIHRLDKNNQEIEIKQSFSMIMLTDKCVFDGAGIFVYRRSFSENGDQIIAPMSLYTDNSFKDYNYTIEVAKYTMRSDIFDIFIKLNNVTDNSFIELILL